MEYIRKIEQESVRVENKWFRLIGRTFVCLVFAVCASGCGGDNDSGELNNQNSPPVYAEYYVESAVYDQLNNIIEVIGIYRPHLPIEACSEIPTAEIVHELSVDDFEHFSDSNNGIVQPSSYIPISKEEFEDRAPNTINCADVVIHEDQKIMICDRKWVGGFDGVDPTLDPPSVLKCSYADALEGGKPIEPQHQSIVLIGCGYCQ